MHLAVARSELKSRRTERVRFVVATDAHDAGIRTLLRETPMPGRISISMEHEPSHFAAVAIGGAEHQTLVGLHNDRVIACGSVAIRTRFINGRPMRVGYLGGLRIARSHQGRPSLLQRGYEAFRELLFDSNVPICFTSIVADNHRAGRMLEAGLPGMPRYQLAGEFVTLIVRSRKGPMHSSVDSAEILEHLNASNRSHQFAPFCSADELPNAIRYVRARDDSLTCAALSDLRANKQLVVRDYSPALARLRPFINIAAAVTRRPKWPDIGSPIALAYVSHLAGTETEHLLRSLQAEAHENRIDYLAIGFDRRDPRLPSLRKKYYPREYLSRLYIVRWNDDSSPTIELDNRLLAPEVAHL